MVKVDVRTSPVARQVGGIVVLLTAALAGLEGFKSEPQVGLLVYAVCAAFVGLILVAERHVLVIDRPSGMLVRRRGVILRVARVSIPIAEVKHLSLVEHTSTRDDS